MEMAISLEFILIFTTILSASLAEYCELFQLPGFRGESLRVPSAHEIGNVSLLTRTWRDTAVSRPPPLYSVQIRDTRCTATVCSVEDFQGNCTVLAQSRKRIRASRLLSLSCQCENATTEIPVQSTEATVIVPEKLSLNPQNCEVSGESEFRDFARNGRKIIGVGRNYMWKQTAFSKLLEVPDKPIIFLKPTSSYLEEGHPIKLPDLGTIWYEIELGVIIGKTGKHIPEESALDYVAGYALTLDLTAKEYLKKSITKGLPWEIGKGFDTACPVGRFIPKDCIPDPHNLQLTCKINGVLTQNENTSKMLFKIPQLIAYISKYMTLEANDIILTGTPDGFGPIKSGDVIEGALDDISRISFSVQ